MADSAICTHLFKVLIYNDLNQDISVQCQSLVNGTLFDK